MKLFRYFSFISMIAIYSCNQNHSQSQNQAISNNCNCTITAETSTQADEAFFNYAKSCPYCPQGYKIYIKGTDKYGNPALKPFFKYSLMQSDWEELRKYADVYSYHANGPLPKFEQFND